MKLKFSEAFATLVMIDLSTTELNEYENRSVRQDLYHANNPLWGFYYQYKISKVLSDEKIYNAFKVVLFSIIKSPYYIGTALRTEAVFYLDIIEKQREIIKAIKKTKVFNYKKIHDYYKNQIHKESERFFGRIPVINELKLKRLEKELKTINQII